MGIPVYWSIPPNPPPTTTLKPTLKRTRPLPSSIRRTAPLRNNRPLYSDIVRRQGHEDRGNLTLRRQPGVRRRPVPREVPDSGAPHQDDEIWSWSTFHRRRMRIGSQDGEGQEDSNIEMESYQLVDLPLSVSSGSSPELVQESPEPIPLHETFEGFTFDELSAFAPTEADRLLFPGNPPQLERILYGGENDSSDSEETFPESGGRRVYVPTYRYTEDGETEGMSREIRF